ncbi:exopolyphosphatase, Ppx/GppA family [Campylobacter ureolyticus]|uniref:Exopolyphosphatase, Ppx/GppA family n=2 Tax=Campylobacter ureolyticus TaxID=827 RepID=A0AAE7E958_9BACT|nr:exopolyphosphatase, Ppx/GppA family [Campylobacter ureolyticus]
MNAKFEVLKTDEFGIQSAFGLKENLSDIAKNKIILALEKISKNYDLKNALAVATEAFRVAKDSGEFFKLLNDKFGIKFEVISPLKECELTKLAVYKRCEMLGASTSNLAIVDLGGASCEIVLDEKFKSFKFGIIKVFNNFLNLENIEKNAKFITKEANKFLKNLKPKNIVLNSTISKKLLNLKQNYKNSKILEFDDFKKLKKLILNNTKSHLKNSDEQAMDSQILSERNLLLCGIYLYENILKGFDDFIIIDYGLKEGVIIEKILKKEIL